MIPEQAIILASNSPRRRELLSLIGRPFRVLAVNVDEKAIEKEILASRRPGECFGALSSRLVEALALAKAAAAARQLSPAEGEPLIIGADTVVVLGEKIYGKPADKAAAEAMLLELAGQTHEVFTGVALLCGSRQSCFTQRTAVRFYPPDARMRRLISAYAESGSPLDKAGGYGIQDRGGLLVEGVEGDFYNVIGLPVAELARRIENFGQPENEEGAKG